MDAATYLLQVCERDDEREAEWEPLDEATLRPPLEPDSFVLSSVAGEAEAEPRVRRPAARYSTRDRWKPGALALPRSRQEHRSGTARPRSVGHPPLPEQGFSPASRRPSRTRGRWTIRWPE